MLAGHRWKYDYDMRQYYCAPLPLGGVESHQWCVGCEVIVTDKELCESGYPCEKIYLDLLAAGKGCDPVEAGTYAEWLLLKSKNPLRPAQTKIT